MMKIQFITAPRPSTAMAVSQIPRNVIGANSAQIYTPLVQPMAEASGHHHVSSQIYQFVTLLAQGLCK
jgi:hypothetical protein